MLFHQHDWSVQHPRLPSKNEQYHTNLFFFCHIKKRCQCLLVSFLSGVCHRRMMYKLDSFTFQIPFMLFHQHNWSVQCPILPIFNKQYHMTLVYFSHIKRMSVPAGQFFQWICHRRMISKLDSFTFKYLSCCFTGTIGQFSILVFLQRMNSTTSLWFISAI